MADMSLEVCTSVGAGQKWDRVETADEADLNLEVLCLWGWDRGLGPGPTYMSELYIYIYTTLCSTSGTSQLKTQP